MADSIKIGSLDISAFKVGNADCKIYLGDTLLYPSTPPPTPTYQWVSYNEGDTVPSKLFYGVKLGDPSMEEASIEFGDSHSTGIAFIYAVDSEYGWSAQDLSGEQIDITEYYDETEGCYVIYFSDLGYGAMPINYPVPNDSFEFDVQLYEETPQSPQWVTFSNGDTIPSTLNIYGVKGNAYDLSNALVNWFTASRANVDIHINVCYSDTVSQSDNVELIFSEIGTCSDYYNLEFEQVVYGGSIQLLIIP